MKALAWYGVPVFGILSIAMVNKSIGSKSILAIYPCKCCKVRTFKKNCTGKINDESDTKKTLPSKIGHLEHVLNKQEQINNQLQRKLSERDFQLKESNKELESIYHINHLINSPDNSIDDVL